MSASETQRPRTASELVRRRVGDPSRGLLFEGQEWTWEQVLDEAAARAALLTDRRPDGPFHVAILMENTPEYVFWLAACALSGAVLVGVNTTRRGEELAVDIRNADCQFVVTDSSQVGLLEGLELGVDESRLFLTDGNEFAALLAGHRGAALPNLEPEPDDLFVLIFTSGSTGAPKAVRMTQGRAARGASRMPFSPDDVLYAAMPLFHGNALNSMVFPAFNTGATLAIRRKFSASAFVPDLGATGATFFSTVGRAISHILAVPPADTDRQHRVKFALGPESSDADLTAFTERFGIPLFGGYGSSENSIVLQPAANARPGQLGTAKPSDDVVAINTDTLEECPIAEFGPNGELLNADVAIGEMVGRNAGGNFEGYYKNDEANAERTRNGWYWSGDLVYRDENGVFYFAGRSGDWMRVDSENFASAPIERILARYEPAQGVAVYPVPDPKTGDQVMAALEMAPGVEFDPEDFASWLAAQPDMGTKWAPKFVRITDRLPVTGTNKLDKKPLRTAKWNTTDQVWFRRDRSDVYEPFTAADAESMHAEFEANNRLHFL